MLFKNQVNLSAVVAAQLDARGYALEAEPGTPLFQLTNTYCLSQTDLTEQNDAFKPNVNLITSSANSMDSHLDGIEIPHTDKLDALSKDIAVHVRQHMVYVKTVAVPLMKEMVEEYTSAIGKYDFAAPTLDVVNYQAPAPAQDASFYELVEQFSSAPQTNQVGYVHLGISSAAVKAACSEPIPGMEDSIAQWFAALGDAKIDYFVQSVFSANPNAPTTLESLIMGDDGFDASCFIFLACMALHDNPPEGMGVSLKQYNDTIHAIRTRASSRLRYLMEEYNALVETKTLIVSYNTQSVKVVKPVFDEFVTDGGSVQLISTIVRMRDPSRTLDQIAQNKDRIEQEQRKQTTILKATSDNQKAATMRDLLMNATLSSVVRNFHKVYPDCPSKELMDHNWPNYVSFKDKLASFIYHAELSNLSDAWGVASRIVSDCVFPHVDCVGKMIFGMEEARKANPNMSTDECSLLACYKYIFDFVMDQIAVKKLG